MAADPDVAGALALLRGARVIAVVGASAAQEKPGSYVPRYLAAQGYRILAVNPSLAGTTELFGEPVRATLTEIAEPVDMVVVFRRSDRVPEHLDDILAMRPPPGSVWLQLGIRNDAFAVRVRAAGIEVVQDRCTLADHRAYGLPPVGPPRPS